ncbi:MAG: hypothetical protein WCC59_15820, partial [Terriglobales bacterium]
MTFETGSTNFCIFPARQFQKQEVLTIFFPPGLHSASSNARLDLAGSVHEITLPNQLKTAARLACRAEEQQAIDPECQIRLRIPAPSALPVVQRQGFLQLFIPVVFTSRNRRDMVPGAHSFVRNRFSLEHTV